MKQLKFAIVLIVLMFAVQAAAQAQIGVDRGPQDSHGIALGSDCLSLCSYQGSR